MSKFRPSNTRSALNYIRNDRAAAMSNAEIVSFCAARQCKHCNKPFKTPFTKDLHEELCQIRLPEEFLKKRDKVRERSQKEEEVLEENIASDDSDSNSDLSEVENTLKKEVRDTDPELSSEEEEPDDTEHKICTSCGLALTEVTPFTRPDTWKPSNEREVLAKLGLGGDETDSVMLKHYIVYDEFYHVTNFDNSLVTNSKLLFFDGVIEEAGQMIEVKKLGPIKEWYDQVILEKRFYVLGSEINYVLDEPHADYFPFMVDPLLKLDLLDVTLEYISERKNPDDYDAYLAYIEDKNPDFCHQLVTKHKSFITEKLAEHEVKAKPKLRRALQRLNCAPKKRKRSQVKQPECISLVSSSASNSSDTEATTSGSGNVNGSSAAQKDEKDLKKEDLLASDEDSDGDDIVIL